MRIRTIRPEFFLHEGLAELKPLNRLLFIGLWCAADRAGRLEDRPKRLKVQILPHDEWDVDAGLTALAKAGFIVRYTAATGGRLVELIQIVNFLKHQRISGKEAEGESMYPPHVGGEADPSRPNTPDNDDSDESAPSDEQPSGPRAAPAIAPDVVVCRSENESDLATSTGTANNPDAHEREAPEKHPRSTREASETAGMENRKGKEGNGSNTPETRVRAREGPLPADGLTDLPQALADQPDFRRAVASSGDWHPSFDRWWRLMPACKRRSQGRAQAFWRAMSDAEREAAIAAAPAFAAAVAKASQEDRNKRFRQADHWLEHKCWGDDPAALDLASSASHHAAASNGRHYAGGVQSKYRRPRP